MVGTLRSSTDTCVIYRLGDSSLKAVVAAKAEAALLYMSDFLPVAREDKQGLLPAQRCVVCGKKGHSGVANTS